MKNNQFILTFCLFVGKVLSSGVSCCQAEALWICTDQTLREQRFTNTPTTSANKTCRKLPDARGRFSEMRSEPFDTLSRAKTEEQQRSRLERKAPSDSDEPNPPWKRDADAGT